MLRLSDNKYFCVKILIFLDNYHINFGYSFFVCSNDFIYISLLIFLYLYTKAKIRLRFCY